MGFGDVDEEVLTLVGCWERLVGQVEVADDGVVEEFDAGGVDADVVGGPAGAELFAAGGELADQVGQVAVVGVAAGFGAQDGDGVVGDFVPVAEELVARGGRGRRTGRCWAARRGRRRRVRTGLARGVGGQDRRGGRQDDGGCARAWSRAGAGWSAGRAGRRGCGVGARGWRAGGAEQVDQVGAFGLVELQCLGDAVDDAVGDAGGVAALEADVVLRRDAGEQGDLFAAQAGDAAAVAAVGGRPACAGVILARRVERNSRISARTSSRGSGVGSLAAMTHAYERLAARGGPCQ